MPLLRNQYGHLAPNLVSNGRACSPQSGRAFFFATYKKMNLEEEKRVLDIALTAGRKPRHTAAGRTIVATGQGEGRKKYLVLANGSALTRAGRYYFEQTNLPRPIAHYDRKQFAEEMATISGLAQACRGCGRSSRMGA